MFPQRIAVVGTGYVGLTTGACLASLGHDVTCADVDEAKVERLRHGRTDILEPGLADLLAGGLAAGRLRFLVDLAEAAGEAEAVFLCLPTPRGPAGAADLGVVESVVHELRRVVRPGAVLVCKSTVPVGTAARLTALVARDDVAVVSNPEFLREGTAVADFLGPDRIVVGADDPDAVERVAALYAGLGAPVVRTDARSAEMVKYAANCFLAMKLSYVNTLGELCERLGADLGAVTEGMGLDRRIGPGFLRPGPGWGGSCLPKDAAAMLRMATVADVDFGLLRAAVEANQRHRGRVVAKVRAAVGGRLAGVRIGVLGLAFKAGTSDLRDSPAIEVVRLLGLEGAEVVAHDPAVSPDLPGVVVVDDPYLVAKQAEAVVVLTEWPQFRAIDWALVAQAMTGRTVVDPRNHLDPEPLARAGLVWLGTGCGARGRAGCPAD
ncbi:UDP-glucose dehydrogenase family protein [Streptoalloteichus hindustanus]|uniref:UDP-glucose 6-dehydrogenase n=1 Tax=Streptoalloteichus hindustanus TaxID=2017 RepID=A0A1M5F9D4_STRHI|nr:UDP-glucose/GDP-mannose dehydrogenase family protein [Streptoalloteichus hindustanus]SHF88086.1 UDP-glucose dehydrogenase [Streptoalloteichus hindustanus]